MRVQYAFIAFLMGQSLEAFMQWKAILQLALGSFAAAISHPSFFVSLLHALHVQLALALQTGPQRSEEQEQGSIMGSLLSDGLLEDSFLRHLLADFSQSLDEEPDASGARIQVMHAL